MQVFFIKRFECTQIEEQKIKIHDLKVCDGLEDLDIPYTYD